MAKHWWARAVVGRTSVSDPLQDDEPPDARFEAEWRQHVKSRLLVILAVLGVWAIAVEAQLVYLQVFAHETFAAKARRQQVDVIKPEAPRGDVVDRHGHLLAYSVPSVDVFADPFLLKTPENPHSLARDLCAAFGDCSADELAQITARLSRPGARRVPVRAARAMSANAAIGLRALMDRRADAKLSQPLIVESRNQRYYPKMELAAHVVGFVGAEGKGGAGVESRYDELIRGVPGRVLAQVDGHTTEMFTRVEREPIPGASVELTIDVALQNIAEQALRAGIAAAGAKGGTAIILGSATGEILAQASFPSYNPNTYGSVPKEARRNPAIQESYEPGSTFKIVTASAAINEGVLSPSDLIDCGPGFITLPGRRITEDKGHNYGLLSFEDALIKSSNVCAVRAGWQTGTERMLRYVERFGFGQLIAPDFFGEQKGGVGGARTLNDSGLASVSMGYQVSVTPIQMVAAANVIASGGLLIEPRVVRAFVRNGRREDVAPKVLRRVITPETALTMTTIMEGVVQRGTGKPAALDLYQVAGKTGTAQKLVGGRYSKTDYNVSFVGFVPSRRPVYTILVVVDTPRLVPAYGSVVAAPIFRHIAEAALQHAGAPPSINPVPPIIVSPERRALPLEPTRTSPMAPTLTNAGGQTMMPDLRGLSLRDALRAATAVGLTMSTAGDGAVVAQTPLPGVPIGSSDFGTLQLRRLPIKAGGGDR